VKSTSAWHYFANLGYLKPDFEILAFFNAHVNIGSNLGFSFYFFFSRKGLALAKHWLSCIFIANLFWWESMIMQGTKNPVKILLLP